MLKTSESGRSVELRGPLGVQQAPVDRGRLRAAVCLEIRSTGIVVSTPPAAFRLYDGLMGVVCLSCFVLVLVLAPA